MKVNEDYSEKFEKAINERNIEEAFTLLVDNSIAQERQAAKLRLQKNSAIREERQTRVNSLALSYEGFGFNKNTGFILTQGIVSGTGMFGLVSPALSQTTMQCFSTIKTVRDTGVDGSRVGLQHGIEDMKRIQDDIKGDDQRSVSTVADLIRELKQLHEMLYQAGAQMTRGH